MCMLLLLPQQIPNITRKIESVKIPSATFVTWQMEIQITLIIILIVMKIFSILKKNIDGGIIIGPLIL